LANSVAWWVRRVISEKRRYRNNKRKKMYIRGGISTGKTRGKTKNRYATRDSSLPTQGERGGSNLDISALYIDKTERGTPENYSTQPARK